MLTKRANKVLINPIRQIFENYIHGDDYIG